MWLSKLSHKLSAHKPCSPKIPHLSTIETMSLTSKSTKSTQSTQSTNVQRIIFKWPNNRWANCWDFYSQVLFLFHGLIKTQKETEEESMVQEYIVKWQPWNQSTKALDEGPRDQWISCDHNVKFFWHYDFHAWHLVFIQVWVHIVIRFMIVDSFVINFIHMSYFLPLWSMLL